MDDTILVRDLHPDEARALGSMMVTVYSSLEGFPSPAEQPAYYAMLADIGRFAITPGTRVLVAVEGKRLLGGLVYFSDMAHYGSGGAATRIAGAAGIRFLAVDPAARRRGVGKKLTQACLGLARRGGCEQVVLHTTHAMPAAWAMYEQMGFVRAPELDFLQLSLPVVGFRLPLPAPAEQQQAADC